MSNKKVPASKRSRSSDRSDRSMRGGEQVALSLVMWLVPLSLFSYVAIKIALATGAQVPEWLVTFDFRRAAILLAIAFLVIASSLVLVPVLFPRKARRAGPWDAKESQDQIPGGK